MERAYTNGFGRVTDSLLCTKYAHKWFNMHVCSLVWYNEHAQTVMNRIEIYAIFTCTHWPSSKFVCKQNDFGFHSQFDVIVIYSRNSFENMQSHISFAIVSRNVATCSESFYVWWNFLSLRFFFFFSSIYSQRRKSLRTSFCSKAIYEEKKKRRKIKHKMKRRKAKSFICFLYQHRKWVSPHLSSPPSPKKAHIHKTHYIRSNKNVEILGQISYDITKHLRSWPSNWVPFFCFAFYNQLDTLKATFIDSFGNYKIQIDSSHIFQT